MRWPVCVVAIGALAPLLGLAQGRDDSWMVWPMERAQAVGRAAYVQGRVGGFFDTRILQTESAYNYKLAATWFHPLAIRATARVRQLTVGMSDGETRAAVDEAEELARGLTVVMVEVDPREGSGVIPLEWSAFLQPVGPGNQRGTPGRGTLVLAMRDVPAFQGVLRRNYDYDRFWLTFPLSHENGEPLLPRGATHAELVVRISGKEGRVRWPLPGWMPGA
jgi:hypothetical protein